MACFAAAVTTITPRLPGRPGSPTSSGATWNGGLPQKLVRIMLRLYCESLEQLRDAYAWAEGRPWSHVGLAHKIARETHVAAAAPRVPRRCVDSDAHRDNGLKAQDMPNFGPNFHAAVARKVPRSRWSEPAAKAALDKEWSKLVNLPWPSGGSRATGNRTTPVPGQPGSGKGRGCWDHSGVREAANVRNEAPTKEIKMHFGRVAELLYEKGGGNFQLATLNIR